jgi:hypothetical protein
MNEDTEALLSTRELGQTVIRAATLSAGFLKQPPPTDPLDEQVGWREAREEALQKAAAEVVRLRPQMEPSEAEALVRLLLKAAGR